MGGVVGAASYGDTREFHHRGHVAGGLVIEFEKKLAAFFANKALWESPHPFIARCIAVQCTYLTLPSILL